MEFEFLAARASLLRSRFGYNYFLVQYVKMVGVTVH